MVAPAAGSSAGSSASSVKRAETTIRALLRAIGDFLGKGHHAWLGATFVALAFAGARAGIEPITTYFYFFAWYPALLALDGLLVKRCGASLLLHRPLALLSLFSWSVPFWLLYEAINLRIENWYYVGTPDSLLASRVFMLVSFATVLPGIVYVYLLLSPVQWIARLSTPRFRATHVVRRNLVAAGCFAFGFALIAPRYGYALVWIALALILEPLNRSARWPSLLRDLEFGNPRRIVLLLLAGLIAGGYWEVMNVPAAAKWIYTVPFFDATIAVEMPPVGFLGFAPFALSAYSFLRFLETRGLAVPFETAAERAPVLARMPESVRVFVLPVLIAFASYLVVPALERETIDSRRGTVQELQSASRRDRAILGLAGIERLEDLVARGATAAGRLEIAQRLVTAPARVEKMVHEARLAHLRGIGVTNARLLGRVGVTTIEDLAARQPTELFAALAALGADAARVKPQRVGKWVLGARAALAGSDS